MGKILSIFIDESGDVGFTKDASKYYIITFVMNNQNDGIMHLFRCIFLFFCKDYSFIWFIVFECIRDNGGNKLKNMI